MFSGARRPEARRDSRAYRTYAREEQRRLPGCPARKMSANFRHGTLRCDAERDDVVGIAGRTLRGQFDDIVARGEAGKRQIDLIQVGT